MLPWKNSFMKKESFCETFFALYMASIFVSYFYIFLRIRGNQSDLSIQNETILVLVIFSFYIEPNRDTRYSFSCFLTWESDEKREDLFLRTWFIPSAFGHSVFLVQSKEQTSKIAPTLLAHYRSYLRLTFLWSVDVLFGAF